MFGLLILLVFVYFFDGIVGFVLCIFFGFDCLFLLFLFCLLFYLYVVEELLGFDSLFEILMFRVLRNVCFLIVVIFIILFLIL